MERSILFKTMVVATLALPAMMGSCKKDKADAPAKPVVKVESVTLNIHDTTIFAGDNFTLTATILPANADTLDVNWESMDKTIADVTSAGTVFGAQNAGSTYIVVTSLGGNHKDSCKVTVLKNIEFKDAELLNALVADETINKDKDNGISRAEAQSVEKLNIANMGISSFDELQYFTNLTELNISSNQITSIDLSSLKNLKTLRCQNNRLTKLDISKNSVLTTLLCNKNSIDTLDIRGNNNLTDLFCGNQANGNLKLELTIDQFNSIWKENGTDSDNEKVEVVMNFFDGATFRSDDLGTESLKNGESTSFKASKGEFTFRLYDSEGNELSFYDPSVLRQIVWTSSDESVATISAKYKDSESANTAIMTVTALAKGNTVIKGTVNDEYTISFNLEVK